MAKSTHFAALFLAVLLLGCDGRSAPRPSGDDPLVRAIQPSNADAVRALLAQDPELEPECGPYEICKPLAIAAGQGNLEIVKLLMESGADPNGRDAYGDTAFIIADHATTLANKSERDVRTIRRYLIENGTDMNQPNAFGITPFMGLCASGDIELATLALENGAKVNAVFSRTVQQDAPDRNSALMWAASDGREEMVAFLLANGADAAYENTGGETAADWASKQGHEEIAELLKDCAGEKL